jgi:DNA-binding CsgD family transcriptional regulator
VRRFRIDRSPAGPGSRDQAIRPEARPADLIEHFVRGVDELIAAQVDAELRAIATKMSELQRPARRTTARTRRVLKRPGRKRSMAAWPNLHGLTTRERDVVRGLARGRTTAEIGRRLGVAPVTVRVLLSRAAAKLGVKSRSALMETLKGRGRPAGVRTPLRQKEAGATIQQTAAHR